jgi:hypothetical protein
MSAADVFHRARAAGVELSMTPAGNIRWRCLGGLPDDLRRSIAAHKPELLRLLDAKETKPADCCSFKAWRQGLRTESGDNPGMRCRPRHHLRLVGSQQRQ